MAAMSMQQYAVRRNTSHSTIQAAIQNGRLTAFERTKRGKKWFTMITDVDLADRQLEDRTCPARQFAAARAPQARNGVAGAPAPKRILKSEAAGTTEPGVTPDEDQEGTGDLPEDPSMILSPSERKIVVSASGPLARIVVKHPPVEQTMVLIEIQELLLNAIGAGLESANQYQE